VDLPPLEGSCRVALPSRVRSSSAAVFTTGPPVLPRSRGTERYAVRSKTDSEYGEPAVVQRGNSQRDVNREGQPEEEQAEGITHKDHPRPGRLSTA